MCASNNLTETQPRPPQVRPKLSIPAFRTYCTYVWHPPRSRFRCCCSSSLSANYVALLSTNFNRLFNLPISPSRHSDRFTDPPALASREARFEVLRRVPLVVAISDLSPQESKESSTESSHHKQEVREHRQPGTHSTIAIPVSTEYTTLYTRPTTVKC